MIGPVNPLTAFLAIADSFSTGLAGTLTVEVLDASAAAVYGPSAAGITESPASSGRYQVTLTAPALPGNYSLYWLDPGSGDNASEDLVVESAQVPAAGPPGPPGASIVGPPGPPAYPSLYLQPLIPARAPLYLQPPSGFGSLYALTGDPLAVLYGSPTYVIPYRTPVLSIDNQATIRFGQNYLFPEGSDLRHMDQYVVDGAYTALNNRWFMRSLRLLEVGDTVDDVIARSGPNNDRPYGISTNPPLGGATGVGEGAAIGRRGWKLWINDFGAVPNFTVGGGLGGYAASYGGAGVQIPRHRTASGDISQSAHLTINVAPKDWPSSLQVARWQPTGHLSLGPEGMTQDLAPLLVRGSNGKNEIQVVQVNSQVTAGTFALQFVVSTPAAAAHPASPAGGETPVSGVADDTVWVFTTFTNTLGETVCGTPRRVGPVPPAPRVVNDLTDDTFVVDGTDVDVPSGMDPIGSGGTDSSFYEVIGEQPDLAAQSVTGKTIHVQLLDDAVFPPGVTGWNLYLATGAALPTVAYKYGSGGFAAATTVVVQNALPTSGPTLPLTDTASETSGPIAFNAAATGAGSVQAALDAMTLLGSGQTTVTKPSAGKWQIEFAGTLAKLRLNKLVADGSLLVAPATVPVPVTVKVNTRGRPSDAAFPVVRVRPADNATGPYLYIDSPHTAANDSISALLFDAAAGTHPALHAGSTKTSPGTVTGWIRITVAGNTNYIPFYSSTTS